MATRERIAVRRVTSVAFPPGSWAVYIGGRVEECYLFGWFRIFEALLNARQQNPYCYIGDRFMEAWYRLSLRGWCDGLGGMEYRRVRRAYKQAGRPKKVCQFIRIAANSGP